MQRGCVNGNQQFTAARKAGFLSLLAHILDFSMITVGPDHIGPINQAALDVSVVEQTEPRAVRYSVSDETGLILEIVPRYSESLLKTTRRALRRVTIVKRPAFVAWVRAFVSFAHFFSNGTLTTAMTHKSSKALLQNNFVALGKKRAHLIGLESVGKLVMSSGSFRRIMDQSMMYITKFREFSISYESTRKEPINFADSWRKRFFKTEHKSDFNSADLVAPKDRKVQKESGEVVLPDDIDINV